jgi:hypothetical protein
MNRPYSMSEEDFYKLEAVRDSIALVQILAGEVQRPTTYTPQMIAAFLVLIEEHISVVIKSVSGTFSTR